MPRTIESLAPDIAAPLKRLTADLVRVAGANLAGLILHNDRAPGRRRSRNRVVKVVVLLHDASATALADVEPVFRNAWQMTAVEATILTPAEVTRWANAFATRFLEIRNRHIVLAGTSPFATIKVAPMLVRLQVEEKLRRLLLRLRLRRNCVERGKDRSLADSLADIVRPFARLLTLLLQLYGRPLPIDDRPVVVFLTAAPVFGLDGKALSRLVKVRRSSEEATNLAGLYEKVFAAIARKADLAAQAKDPRTSPPQT
jgi:hypothetical protein